VAQRTGAERFLASAAKSASTGILLVLALAALALAGCGGGGSSADQGSTSSTGASASAAKGAAGTGESAQGSSENAGPTAQAGAKSKAGGKEGGATNSGQDGEKHGARIAQPKGPREKAPTPEEIANATVADITLESYSPFASGNGEPASLPANYSCDGEDKWPQFHWSGVPAGTAEVILYGMNVQPVEGKLFVDWAVAGLDPNLPEIVSGRLPKGAVVGTNSFGKQGYSLCPQGKGEIYMFALYALPKHLGLRPGFDARKAREEILEVSGNVGLLPMLYAHH
jgi:phosphatidylethanolamine-binding protein (PEBP) family uncharacterized protein